MVRCVNKSFGLRGKARSSDPSDSGSVLGNVRACLAQRSVCPTLGPCVAESAAGGVGAHSGLQHRFLVVRSRAN